MKKGVDPVIQPDDPVADLLRIGKMTRARGAQLLDHTGIDAFVRKELHAPPTQP